MSFKIRLKWSPLVLSLILGIGPSLTLFNVARAQSLEDSIDAELDSASKGLNPDGAKLESHSLKKQKSAGPTLDGSAPQPTHASNSPPPPQTKAMGASEPMLDDGGALGDSLQEDASPQSDSVEKPSAQPMAKPKKAPLAAPKNSKAAQSPQIAPPPSESATRSVPKPGVAAEPAINEPLPERAESSTPAPESAPVAEPAQQVAPSEPPTEPAVESPAETPAEAPSAVATSHGSSAGDEPNLNFEKRLSEIFKNDHPISDDEWSEMVGPRSEEMYSVQAGDTLWDISTTLFGDGMFWTKIWAENGAIENPHLIAPGKGIRFIAGNESNAPSLKVTESAVIASNDIKGLSTELQPDAPVYEDQLSTVTADSSDIDELAVIPRPDIPSGKVSKPPTALPGSFQNHRIRYRGKFDKSGLDAPVRKAFVEAATVIPSSYLSEGLPASVGHIDEVETGERYASVGQNVFVKLNKAYNIGDRLNVLFPKGTVNDAAHGDLGPVVEVGGTIELAEALSQSKFVYRAMVVYMVNPIRTNSFLTEAPLPRVTVKKDGRKIDADVRVVGAEFDENRKLVGQGAIIYLDGGHRDGIQDGDILAVQSRRGAHRESTVFPEYRKTIGMIKIVQSLQNVSTAMVLENSEEIRIGDRTGGPLPQSAGGIHYETISPDAGSELRAKAPTVEVSRPTSVTDPDQLDSQGSSDDGNTSASAPDSAPDSANDVNLD